MSYLFYNNWYYSASVFPTMEDHLDPVNNAYFSGLHQEIQNIENAIGLNPTGTFNTIAERLNSFSGFTDRGDPSANDFIFADFAVDGVWHDLSLASIVPAGAKAVVLKVGIKDDEINSHFALKKRGNYNDYNINRFRTQVANQYFEGTMIVPCDTDRYIRYRVENLKMLDIWMCVIGWW